MVRSLTMLSGSRVDLGIERHGLGWTAVGVSASLPECLRAERGEFRLFPHDVAAVAGRTTAGANQPAVDWDAR